MRILLFDNYDSFTYNLKHYLEFKRDIVVDVIRNDKIKLSTIGKYDKIVISPGPGLPQETKNLIQLIDLWHVKRPILGVCLGHQAIAQYFGAKLIHTQSVYHGVAIKTIVTNQNYLFKNLPPSFDTGRYHSWLVSNANLPECLQVTAIDKMNNIMALQHKKFPIQSVQFHPESILSQHGKQIIKNWVLHPC
jgi:anthranilate synthase component II